MNVNAGSLEEATIEGSLEEASACSAGSLEEASKAGHLEEAHLEEAR